MLTKHFTHFILFFFIPTLLIAQLDSVFKFELPVRLRKIQTIIDSKVDSNIARSNLIDLKNLAIQHGDLQSKFLCELNEIRMESIRSSALKDKDIDRMQMIIQQSEENEFTLIQIHGIAQMGELLSRSKRQGAALSYYLRAYDLRTKVDTNLLPKPLAALDYYLACTFYRLRDYPRARYFSEKSIEENLRGPVSHYRMLLHDMLSQICLNLKDFNCSAFEIEQARKIYYQKDTSNWFFKGWNGIFEGNLAKINYFKNEYNEAIPLFIHAIKITEDAKLFDNTATFGLLLADCYLKTNQERMAADLIPKIKQAVYKKGDEQNYRDLYRLLSVIPEKRTSVNKAKDLLDSIEYWTNKLKTRIDTNSQIIKDMEYETIVGKKREEQLKQKIQKQLFYRSILWSSLGILVILSCLVIYRKQIELKLQIRTTQEISEKADQALAIARAELSSFKNSLVEKTKQLEALEENIGNKDSRIELESLRTNTILTEQDWINFKKLFEKVNTGYLSRLKNQFPELTAGEIRFVVLIKLALNNKEMASILGVSTGAIRTMRSRLLKKLNLAEDENLEKRVDEI